MGGVVGESGTGGRLGLQRQTVPWRKRRLVPLEVVRVDPDIRQVLEQPCLGDIFDLVENAS